MSHHRNIVRLKSVYHALGELRNKIVFLGGATISLYADKPEITDVRPTDDVDVPLEIATYGAYTLVQEKLSSLGFSIDPASKVTCRYRFQGLIIDIMSTGEGVLGFTNRWYKSGFENRVDYALDDLTAVHILSAPYFLATKLEAFKGRGNNDGRTSQDFEDIVFVLDNRKAIWTEIDNCNAELTTYLKKEFKQLLDLNSIEEWIAVHLEYETATERTEAILSLMQRFIER